MKIHHATIFFLSLLAVAKNACADDCDRPDAASGPGWTETTIEEYTVLGQATGPCCRDNPPVTQPTTSWTKKTSTTQVQSRNTTISVNGAFRRLTFYLTLGMVNVSQTRNNTLTSVSERTETFPTGTLSAGFRDRRISYVLVRRTNTVDNSDGSQNVGGPKSEQKERWDGPFADSWSSDQVWDCQTRRAVPNPAGDDCIPVVPPVTPNNQNNRIANAP